MGDASAQHKITKREEERENIGVGAIRGSLASLYRVSMEVLNNSGLCSVTKGWV
jgi:hypothetical protein